jgi:hypothetical protein
MATWGEFAAEQPGLAASIRERFDVRKHKTLATLRSDGSPRISGIEVEFAEEQLWLGMMPGSVKLADIERDPRVALHSPTEDPTESGSWAGEAKVAGRVVEVARGSESARLAIDLTEAVLTYLGQKGDRLVIASWHPGRGVKVVERT